MTVKRLETGEWVSLKWWVVFFSQMHRFDWGDLRDLSKSPNSGLKIVWWKPLVSRKDQEKDERRKEGRKEEGDTRSRFFFFFGTSSLHFSGGISGRPISSTPSATHFFTKIVVSIWLSSFSASSSSCLVLSNAVDSSSDQIRRMKSEREEEKWELIHPVPLLFSHSPMDPGVLLPLLESRLPLLMCWRTSSLAGRKEIHPLQTNQEQGWENLLKMEGMKPLEESILRWTRVIVAFVIQSARKEERFDANVEGWSKTDGRWRR